VRQVEAGAQKEVKASVSQARAFVALANLLDRHIERHEAHVFPVIRNAAARRIEEPVSSRESHRTDLTVLQGLPRNL
jgi:hemerythrin-like domain-containing protein